MVQQHKQVYGPVINRFGDVMAHTTRYAFNGIERLAKDARIHPSTLSKIIGHRMAPSFAIVQLLTDALERELGFRIDPREVIALEGGFLTPHVCDLVRCNGCLPECAHDEMGDLKARFAGVLPGTWVSSRYPNGYEPLAEVK